MTHVTCRLTAENRDQLQNHTLGDRVWSTFLLYETVTLTACVPVIRVTRIDRFSRAALRRVIADGVVRRCVEDERRTRQFAAAASPGTAVF